MNLFSDSKKWKLLPEHAIPASFLITILVGALLLMLPVASADGSGTTFLTALFTATTSVCVTGLVVVDTYAHWSFFGQLIILILIQIGGLGMIAVASTILMLTGKKFSLADRMLLRDAFNLSTNSKLLFFLVRVLKGTILIEGIGAALYAVEFIPRFGIARGLWISVFNSVSAFCNAGMDIIGPSSLTDYRGNPLVMGVTMALIILGGIGFVVWFDVEEKTREGIQKRFSPEQIVGRFSEHTKLVLGFTAALLLGGAAFFLLTEYHNPGTIGTMDLGGKMVNSLFESVTLRTAGFATVAQENLTGPSCMIAYIMMFIGGSPVGTAGGIKTVTAFLLIMNVRSYVHHQDKNVVFHHQVSEDAMRKASAVAFVGLFTVMALTFLLLIVNPVSMEDALFEVASACGTVGLSRGLTASLGTAGRYVIILAMYLGRIGPISLVAFFSRHKGDQSAMRYSEGTFYVG
ncbi:potassium transporter TrkG [[Clostridium] aminophilum]|uniref:TrkH family potassium uptake protein n=1 Tax=[Clostridium] aminophilum TaxID=1526 RepID=UPI0033222804